MQFEPEFIHVGEERGTEYSLMRFDTREWLTLEDGDPAFSRTDPISLMNFYPDPEAGTEEFARKLMNALRASHDLSNVGVFGFSGIRRKMIPSGIEINRDFKPSPEREIFEVRGKIVLVRKWTDDYLTRYPTSAYDTRIVLQEHLCTDDIRVVRVTRSITFD
jgi:hypothetical protein